MTNPNENVSESQQIEVLEQEVAVFKNQYTEIVARVKELLYTEDPTSDCTHHEEIFRLQQNKLRIDTEIQFLNVKIRRLKSTW